MRTGRRLLILTILMAVLIVLIFLLPAKFDQAKMIMGASTVVILFLFLYSIWQWRKTKAQDDLSELQQEMVAKTEPAAKQCLLQYSEDNAEESVPAK